MKIIKDGFYKLSEFNTKTLIIEDNIIISIFDDLSILPFSKGVPEGGRIISVDIGENSKVNFYSVLENEKDYKIKFLQNKEKSELKVNYLLLSKNNKKIKAKIYSELGANYVKSNVKIISIIGKKGFVDLDGIIKIKKGIKKVNGNLEEENLFLGDTGKVKGIPTLLVESNDVKASHSCKMERIGDDKLFYLRSRGIGRENALSIIIEAQIKSLFGSLSIEDNEFYEDLIINILKKGI